MACITTTPFGRGHRTAPSYYARGAHAPGRLFG
jgi:hypothetical protein